MDYSYAFVYFNKEAAVRNSIICHALEALLLFLTQLYTNRSYEYRILGIYRIKSWINHLANLINHDMNSNKYALRIAGTIFGIVAFLHLLRIITNTTVLIGNWSMPLWFNWIGLVATGFLCGWLWSISVR